MADIVLKWKRVPTGSQPKPRHGHRAVNIDDLMIVFGGGNEGLIDELYVFDTKKCLWLTPVTQGEKPSECAAYGFAVYGNRIFLFGGIVEHSKFSNDLYVLTCTSWEWRKLKPEPPKTGIPPCPRLGHSFTCVADKIYLFGGLTKQTDIDDPFNEIPIYLNDLYTLDISDSETKWDIPSTFGNSPSPRESHTVVAYIDKITKKSNLVIYGGMSGCRLGDVWLLDMNTMMWCHPEIKGFAPLPRSLHTATLIGHRMYIFGGWVPIATDDCNEIPLERKWECTNTLACLNLQTMVWEGIRLNAAVGIPRARAGHCSVGISERLYVWSGRDGLHIDWNNRVCCNDFWYLEVAPPQYTPRITLVHALSDSFELKWLEIPTTQVYLLEVQRMDSLLTVPNLNEEPLSSISPISKMSPVSPIPTLLPSIKYPLSTNNASKSTTAYIGTGPQDVYVFEPEVQRSNILYPTIEDGESEAATLFLKQINEQQLNIVRNTDKGYMSIMPYTMTSISSANNQIVDSTNELMSPQLAMYQKPLISPESSVKPKHDTIYSTIINSTNLHMQPKKCIIRGKSYTVKPASAAVQQSFKSHTQKAYSCQSTLIPNSNDGQEECQQFSSVNLVFDKEVNQLKNDNILKLSLYDRLNVTRDERATEKWCTVGFFTERSCTVFNYIDFDEWNCSQYKDITADNIPDLSTKQRINLKPRTGYKFRLSAINDCGRGSVGDFISCITCLPGLPCSPTEFKIAKLFDGVRLSWEPPPNISIETLEYSIYLVVKSPTSNLALRRVYCGPQLTCNISNYILEAAYIDYDYESKPAKVFRIWARNNKGYGPFTQIRYLQESKAGICASSSGGTAIKRPAYKLNAFEKRFK